ncbi:hypothetical protein ABZT43_51285, partial [Streptomyces sp. NPDC005349]|uniref:hypothetical protein n=1 Tax=Streptomyces sp. NPDC005349 TaxID=3157037 RepID=UPI0033A83BAD
MKAGETSAAQIHAGQVDFAGAGQRAKKGGGVARASDRLTSRLSGLAALTSDIELATMRLHEIQRHGTRTSTIRIRDEFFYSKKGQEPSICKIGANKGLNLQIYLLLLFEAQCRKRTGIAGPARIRVIADSPEEITWDSVTVAAAKAGTQKGGSIKTTPRQNKNRQIRSALQRLKEENLALVSRGATSVTALHEAAVLPRGTSHEYTIPRTPLGTINIPTAFFTRGWIYCLTGP